MARGKSREKADILARQILAIDLRRAGYSYRAIGERLKVSHETARQDVESELERLAKLRDGKVEAERELELERLDMLMKALAPMAQVGNPGAVNSFLKCMERRAKLLGLDAPQKIAPTDPNGNEPFKFRVESIDYRNALAALAPTTTRPVSDRDPSGEN